MEDPKDQKEYQKWYYENVTKPKRDALKPNRRRLAPMRNLGEPTVRKCEYPLCGKEFKSKFPERRHCSISCGIKHSYDIKHGVELKADEDYCPGCNQVYHISMFPVNKAAASGRTGYCRTCQNEKVKQYNKSSYDKDPAKFLEAQKQYNQKKKKE